MTPHDLIAAFEPLADAPDGVQRLRELVLSLAVRGKLVPQDAGDQPIAHVLGRRIAAVDEAPFALPAGWSWSSIELVGEVLGGGTPSKSNPRFWSGEIPWVSPKDMKVPRLADSQDHVSPEAVAGSSVKLVPPGSVLMVVRGMILAHSFPVALTEVEVTVNQDMKALVPFSPELAEYLLLLLQGSRDRVLDLVERSTHGTCKLPYRALAAMPLALPPLAEQRRIVARVDELMGLLDRLEAARTARDEVRRAARDAALAALRDAPDAEAVEAAWGRIARQMDELFIEPEDVEPLRQAILQLAVRGRLVAQEAGDEPAEVILQGIAAEKARLVQERKDKKPKALPPIEPEEVPFDLPEAWAWARLETVCTVFVDCPHSTPQYDSAGQYPAIRPRDVAGGVLRLATANRVERETFDAQNGRHVPAAGDVAYARELSLGWGAAIPEGVDLCLSQGMMVMRPAEGVLLPYFMTLLNGPMCREQALRDAVGAAHLHLNLSKIRCFLVPVPPLAEQHRIVAAIDHFMGLVDQLVVSLAAAQATRAAFAAAAVHHLAI